MWTQLGTNKINCPVLSFFITFVSMSKEVLVARLDNQLVMRAHYNLSSNEQKLILFLVSKIDANQRDFHRQVVKIKEIERFLSNDGKRWGSIYERVDIMCGNISRKNIILPKGFIIDGKAIRMHRYIQWFTDIEPFTDEDGDIALKFQFAETLKDFLLELHEYVRVNLVEVLPMRGKHAIRMYQIFKSERDRTKKYKTLSKLEYQLDELKALLGISNKYAAFQDFKRRVLKPICEEINECSSEILVKYEFLKKGRSITGIRFLIKNKSKTGQNVDYVPKEADIIKLPHAVRNAYFKLVAFGVKEGIAMRQLLPRIKGEILHGFEDYFVEYAIVHFKSKSNAPQKVGAFVKWWIEVESFDNIKGKDWAKIVEQVLVAKKQLKAKNPEAFDNRLVAKDMTHTQFVSWYQQNSEI